MGTAQDAARRQRLDLADGSVHNALFADALALLDDLPDHPQGDAELEVDGGLLPRADGDRHDRLLPRRGKIRIISTGNILPKIDCIQNST